jgi:hypothetical protein
MVFVLLLSLTLQPGVPDVDQAEFASCRFVFAAHGRNAAAIGQQITVWIDDGRPITSRSHGGMMSNLRVVSTQMFIDGRIPMTRVTLEVTPRQYRYLSLAQKKGQVIIVPPPPNEGGGGVDRDLLPIRE